MLDHIHQRWTQYERDVLPLSTTYTQRLELRHAYYVGATAAFEYLYKVFLGSYPRT